MHTTLASDPDLKLGQITLWGIFITRTVSADTELLCAFLGGSVNLMPFQKKEIFFFFK